MSQDKGELQFVTFTLDKEVFGIDVRQAREIIKVKEPTRIPQAPPYIKGIINLRGQITPIVDLRTILGLDARGLEDENRVIITEINGETVGILVDAVLGVQRISMKDIDPLPELTKGGDSNSIIGIAKRENSLMILIDIEKLLGGGKLEGLELSDLTPKTVKKKTKTVKSKSSA